MDLLKSQKADLAKVIGDGGFLHADFDLATGYWEYHIGGRWLYEPDAATLTHKASGFYFTFAEVSTQFRADANRNAPYVAEMSPGAGERVATEAGLHWHQILDQVSDWLTRLKHELTAPDVWAEMAGLGGGDVERGADQFTGDELRQVDEKLDDLFNYVRQHYDLAAGSTARIEADLAYLKETARSQNRLAWKLMVLGVVLGWALNAVIPAPHLPDLVTKVGDILQGLVGVMRFLPPL